MKRILPIGVVLIWVVILLVGMALVLAHQRASAAQAITPLTPAQFSGTGVHTSCQISPTGQSNLCLAGDGAWLSVNGAAYVQIGAAGAPGPAGPAGPAGAQGPPGPAGGVTSVNGKTGAVTLTLQ